MSEVEVLHEWKNKRFCYRVLGGSVPRVERGGAADGVRVFAGVVVCNNAETVNELARLAARVAELEAAVASLADDAERYMEYHAEKFYGGTLPTPTGLTPSIAKARSLVEREEE